MAVRIQCEHLDKFRMDAVSMLRAGRRIRRSRDLSFYQDAELTREEHRSVDALIKHLLVGHGGKPCPAGGRPIVDTDWSNRGSLSTLQRSRSVFQSLPLRSFSS